MNENSLKNFGWSDADVVARRTAAIKSSWTRTPEQMERLKQGVKKSWTPERREQHRSRMVEQHASKRSLRDVSKDDRAFISKLKAEGFTRKEIQNLLTIGRTEE